MAYIHIVYDSTVRKRISEVEIIYDILFSNGLFLTDSSILRSGHNTFLKKTVSLRKDSKESRDISGKFITEGWTVMQTD